MTVGFIKFAIIVGAAFIPVCFLMQIIETHEDRKIETKKNARWRGGNTQGDKKRGRDNESNKEKERGRKREGEREIERDRD